MIFYKYVYNEESLILILQNQTLKVTSPNDFNDPFDCVFSNPKFYTKDIKRKFRTILKKIPNLKKLKNNDVQNEIDNLVKEIIQYFKQLFNDLRDNEWKNILDNIKILSLTTEKDNILMWSHYANSHKGYLLGFDFSNDLEIYKNIKQVKYGDNKIDNFTNKILDMLLNILKTNFKEIVFENKNTDNFLDNKILKDEVLKLFKENIMEYLWIKKDIWNYEKEYRLVLDKKSDFIKNIDNTECIQFKKESLKEIIFGIKNKDNNVLNLLKEFQSIELYNCKDINGELKIYKNKSLDN